MTIVKQIKSGLFHGFGFVLMLGLSGIAYGAYVSLTDVSSGQTLTADTFNKLLENQRVLKTSVDTISLATNPSGAVMAFDLETCPNGWTEYTALQGKFIRGADTGAVNDPNFATRSGGVGSRKIGSTQGDSTKLLMNGSSESNSPEGNSGVGIIMHKPNVEMVGIEATFWGTYASRVTLRGAMDTTYGGGSETRGKNVYLLYCRKN